MGNLHPLGFQKRHFSLYISYSGRNWSRRQPSISVSTSQSFATDRRLAVYLMGSLQRLRPV
jgi:hypothetical protein